MASNRDEDEDGDARGSRDDRLVKRVNQRRNELSFQTLMLAVDSRPRRQFGQPPAVTPPSEVPSATTKQRTLPHYVLTGTVRCDCCGANPILFGYHRDQKLLDLCDDCFHVLFSEDQGGAGSLDERQVAFMRANRLTQAERREFIRFQPNSRSAV